MQIKKRVTSFYAGANMQDPLQVDLVIRIHDRYLKAESVLIISQNILLI